MRDEKAPLFSVVTITYNNREGLKKTAKSILSQTDHNYEWIIIDGNSNDGTQNDFTLYPSAHIISEPDLGIYDAMNKGVKNAKGDYIIFMNAGDIFANQYVLQKVKSYAHSQPNFIYGDAIEEGFLKKARSHERINWGMFTHHQSMFYERNRLKSILFDLEYKIAADYDSTLKFLREVQNIIYVPLAICIFEQGGVSQTNAKLGRDEQFLSRKRNKACGIFSNYFIKYVQIARYLIRKNVPQIYWRLLSAR